MRRRSVKKKKSHNKSQDIPPEVILRWIQITCEMDGFIEQIKSKGVESE